MKRISKAKRRHLIQCAVAMQPWRIDTEGEARRQCEAALADLRDALPMRAQVTVMFD